MTMQLRSLHLYNFQGKRRSLFFKLGEVNIITGQSATGKSAIISIVEYCLGSSPFNVPDTDPFESVAWYGVLYKVNDNEIFVAKPRPETPTARTQSGLYYLQGASLEIPSFEQLKINSNDNALNSIISSLLGFSPNLHIPDEDETRQPLEATLNHARFYLFQKQNVIANQETLFHRQSEPFIPQTIKDTLPYLLGAIEEMQLSLQDSLARAKRRLRLAQRKLREAEAIASNRLERANALLEEARQVGFEDNVEDNQNLEEVIQALRDTQSWVSSSNSILVGKDERIDRLIDRREQIKLQAKSKYREIRTARAYLNSANGFSSEASEQVMRLESINLFKNASQNQNACPLCSSTLYEPLPTIAEIQGSLENLQTNLQTVEQHRPRLREYIEEIQSEYDAFRQQITEIELALEALYAEQEATQQLREQNVRIARVVGRISLYMESISWLDEDNDLHKSVIDAENDVQHYEGLLAPMNVEEILTSILNVLSSWMTSWAKFLQLELSDYPFRFDFKNLTVVADRPGRPIPLIRMGSGENWLGCHLITHLALHKYFVTQKRPVPNFLILDQPSQIYFPSESDYKAMRGNLEDTEITSHDGIAVHRMFNLLFDVCKELFPDFQIIIMEHANLKHEAFQKALVEQPWNEGKALIPQSWLH
ncbi:MAG: DUF3732 domain-containing protein [Anaerolineales bacterium]|nr:DUF3732 domain-containing protein [Anaerolineales bacterium]